MPDSRTQFQRNVSKVKADARAASGALVHRLKRMSAEEFLRQPRSTFNRLTLAQYREIVSVIAPGMKLPETTSKAPEKKKRRLIDWWHERSVGFRSFVSMAVVTVMLATLGTLTASAYKIMLSRIDVVRPANWQTWPACSRLSAHTDGCIYRPTQDLTWEWVAWQLDLPVETLRRNNPHQPLQFIIRRAPLAIWRGRGRLED